MSEMATKRPVLKIPDSDLQCQNGCGYYGNPAWNGYCSVCYREVYLRRDEDDDDSPRGALGDMNDSGGGGGTRGDQRGSLGGSVVPTSQAAQSFSKFEEKRRQIAGKGANTVKNIFRLTKDSDRAVKSKSPTSGGEDQQVGVEFFEYLKKLRKSAALDVSKLVNRMVESMDWNTSVGLDQHSLHVHNFYNDMFNRINTNSAYKGMSEEARDNLMDQIERYLTNKFYQVAFCSPQTDDEERDLALQNKIRSLHWITPEMMEVQVNEDDPKEKAHVYEAITAIIEVNSILVPQDKLACIAHCSREVLSLICCRGRPANADEFLPALIWLILKANPPLLQSNIQFITRFANPARLNTGEAGYFFTNLCCAVHFIENLTHESLSMSADDFDRHMRGEAIVQLTGDNTFACEGLRIMAENDARLNQMFLQYESLAAELAQTETETSEFQAGFLRRMAEFRDTAPSSLPVKHARREEPSLREILSGDHHDNQVKVAPGPSTQHLNLDASIDETLAAVLPPPLLPAVAKDAADPPHS